MCVVTYLPLPEGGFVLTSNRDELSSRPAALAPQAHTLADRRVCFPKDPTGGGTWLATSGTTTVCLLNGAFEPHLHQPPYRKSRGLVVLDYVSYSSPALFTDRYDFSGIEPFTLVIVSHASGGAPALHELRWNGTQVYLRNMPPRVAHIWSSVTLYTLPMAELRKTWLAQFLYKQPQYTPADVFAFHQTAGDGDPAHDFVMRRPAYGLQTVSITQVYHRAADQQMRYLDLNAQVSVQVPVG